MATQKQQYDDLEEDKYFARKKGKMKTLRDDDRYGTMFGKNNKLKNIDPDMFDYDDDYEYDQDLK